MSLSHLAGVDPEPRTASPAPNAGRCHDMSRTYSVWMPRLQFWKHRRILSCCAKSENGLAEDGSHHGNQMKNLHFWTEQKLSQTKFWIFCWCFERTTWVSPDSSESQLCSVNPHRTFYQPGYTRCHLIAGFRFFGLISVHSCKKRLKGSRTQKWFIIIIIFFNRMQSLKN